MTSVAARTGEMLNYANIASCVITVNAEPSASGKVAGGGVYGIGDTVTVSAVANKGYKFLNWTLSSDKDPKGAVYNKLKLKSTKQSKKSITLSWLKPGKATKFVLYGNKCGAGNKMKKIGTYTERSKKFTNIAGKKIKKGTYYKIILVALDKNNNVVSTSKMIHVATKGGKVTNPKKVVVKKGKRAVSKITFKED